jgi:hypothetical protein
MKLQHTVQIALALNARVIDDHGAPVAAYVGRVVYLWLWLPTWLWRASTGPARHSRRWPRSYRRTWRWVPAQAYFEAWLVWCVGRLLVAEAFACQG